MIEAFLRSPLLGLCLCIGTYAIGMWIQKKTRWFLANPLLIASAACIALLLLLDIPYENFAAGAQMIHVMLGPVTALLALGIYNQRATLKEYFIPVLVGCSVGSAVSIFSVLGLCRLLGVDQAVAAAIVPKSCTTAIAVGIAENLGGVTAVAAACVLLAGLTGALFAPVFCRWLGVRDPVAQGVAIGACSHALGTTKAREIGEVQGAMSSIAIGVCGLISVGISLFLTL